MRISISSGDSEGTGCRSVFGKLVGSVFFGLFLGMGLFFLVMLIGETVRDVATWRWDPTPCTIVSSEVVDSGDDEQPFEASVRYRYAVDGQEHLGDRVSRRANTESDFGKAQRRALRYEQDSETTCYVDPADPSRAVLERSVPWTALMVLLPLVFVVIGGGGLFVIWRPGRAQADQETVSISQGARGQGGHRVLLVMGLVFVVVGVVVFVAVFMLPMIRLVRAISWPEVPCTVISSTVRSHTSDDGTTYKIDILYEYEYSGRTWRSNRYGFLDVSSSGYAGKKEVVDQYPPGTEGRCWVDPEDPTRAVLDRSFRPTYLLGLLPLIFVLAGGALVAHSRKVARKNRRSADPAVIAEPSGGESVELESSTSPAAKFFGIVLVALVWNGIVSVLVWQVIKGWQSGRPDWFLTIFTVPFVLVGLGLAVGIFYFALALANPRPNLVLLPAQPRLGDDLRVEWRFTGRSSRINHLTIVIEGKEEATYQRGTDTHTDTEVFATLGLIDTVNYWEIGKGVAEVFLPEDTMHSFAALHNKIVWSIKVEGEIHRWPDVDDEFPIAVLPLKPEAAR